MANENMIKFLRGNVANLPQTATAGALYFTKDEGIYLGMEDGSYHRYGDFITVADVDSLPTSGAHATCMYYCTKENILARYDSAKGWIQINKQPTAEEMKTLLGLGSLAYKSEVAEGDLNSDLAAKINAASGAQHTHANESVLNGISAEKVAAWDASEQNAKDYADGLNTAMNTRVEALEAIDHEHSNKALLDTYTQTEADLADAVSKKHSHSFNETELNKIAEGDVAKWNAVVADHLTSADKTTLENAIKEAKKAGTDANTNIEAYKVTNDARVLAVEEDIAEITGENGILAQAKTYSDNKLATARTEISAEIDADVKVVADELAGYKTSNDAALAGVKATAEAAATKEYTDTELAKKVDKDTYATDKAGLEKAIEDESKARSEADAGFETRIAALEGNFGDGEGTVESQIAAAVEAEAARVDGELAKKVDKVDGKDLIATSEIERLATLHNYDDTQVKADIAKKADAETMTTELGKKVDKVEGYSLVSDAEIARLANVNNYNDEEVRGLVGDNAKAIEDLEGYVGTFTHDTAKTVIEYVDAKTDGVASSEYVDYLKGRIDGLGNDVEFILGGSESGFIGLLDRGTYRLDVFNQALSQGSCPNASELYDLIPDARPGDIISAYADNPSTGYYDNYSTPHMFVPVIGEGYGGQWVKLVTPQLDNAYNMTVAHTTTIWEDYLKAADKTELQDQITANANAITALTDGIDPDKIDGLTDLVNWANEHAPEVASIKEDIEANAKAISDHEALAAETYETKADATSKKTEIDGRLGALEGKVDVEKVSTAIADAVKVETERATGVENGLAGRIKDLEDNKAGYATTGEVATAKSEAIAAAETKSAELDAALKTELEGKISSGDETTLASAKAYTDELANGQVATNKNDVATLFELMTWGEF